MKKFFMRVLFPVIIVGVWISLGSPGAAAADTPSSDPLPGIHASGERLVDSLGRQVILRGVNAGGRSKLPPFFPFDPTPDFETALNRYADNIAALGFNVVRLLVIYEAAEPIRGQYNEEYLQGYDRMVQAMGRRGIRVIVDSHQDVFSRRFCGDGFPDWALFPEDQKRPTNADCKLWSLRYFWPTVAKNEDRLWQNQDGVMDSYVAFFKMLAERYRGEPAVIGFEPMNEPFPGAWGFAHYSEWYQTQLFALYEKVGQAVSAVDPRYLIFADICPLENQGAWNTRRPGPKLPNLVLTPHYYDAGTFGKSLAPGGDQWFMRRGLKRHLRLGNFWNAPVLITEYGISPLFKTAPAYINKLYAVFDELQLSGTFWEASISSTIWNQENTSLFNPDGSKRPGTPYLDRPYPRAVAGVIRYFKFDPQDGRFEMEWTEDPKITAPTELYLPERLYHQSPKVQLDPPGPSRFDPMERTLFIESSLRDGSRKLVVSP